MQGAPQAQRIMHFLINMVLPGVRGVLCLGAFQDVPTGQNNGYCYPHKYPGGRGRDGIKRIYGWTRLQLLDGRLRCQRLLLQGLDLHAHTIQRRRIIRSGEWRLDS